MAALADAESGALTGAGTGQCFSTEDLPPADQCDAWRSLLGEIIELQPTPEASGGFKASLSSWSLGDIVLMRTVFSGAPVRHWRHRPKSFPDHWCVVLVRSSASDRAGLVLSTPPGDVLGLRSLALPSEARADDAEVLTLFLPRDLDGKEGADLVRTHGAAIDPVLGAVLAGYMHSLARQLPHMSPEHAQGLAAPTRALVAACIAPRVARAGPAEAPLAPPLIDRARAVVRQNLPSAEFGPEQLARLLAVSRSKLYRLFESWGGVAHFIKRERLHEAHRRLCSHHEVPPIHILGNQVGFVDHSTFSRAFRREFGCSPTELRDAGLASHPAR